jgi:DNA-binding beta-propeller fold protein YncE
MKRYISVLVAAGAAFGAGLFMSGTPVFVQGQPPTVSTAAVPGQKGGIDVMGPYDVVVGWPKPLSNLAGHEGWTWGAVQGVFAESPDRVFILQRGELPDLKRPNPVALNQVGPSLAFPTGQVPFRNASQGMNASPPGAGGPGADPDDPAQAWKGRIGIDARWEHLMVAFNSAGDIVEQFPQWDSLLRRPHAIYINPYDAEKHLWVVDDHSHAIFKMTHDGKTIVQTLGTPGKAGADASHFNRPTFLAFLPDSTMFVADGYNGNRVVKFDKNGKFVLAWGEKGAPGGNERRPGYFNTVHGITADPMTRRVYVSDRSNRRMQVFDENGKFVDQWDFSRPSNTQFLMIPADRSLWAIEDTTSKVVKYDLEGHYLYSWGLLNDFPGSFLNPHGFSVDQEQNLYVAEVGNGRVQKFKPRPGANPSMLIGKPAYSAWR